LKLKNIIDISDENERREILLKTAT